MATAISDVLLAPFGGYRPSANEEFMNADQLAYFRQKLLRWKDDILKEAADTMTQLKDGPIQEADLNDRASSETDWGIHLRTRDRQRKLICKIDSALRRIDSGEYGFCEVSGEPISLARLEARPVATMTVEAQERHERNERISARIEKGRPKGRLFRLCGAAVVADDLRTAFAGSRAATVRLRTRANAILAPHIEVRGVSRSVARKGEPAAGGFADLVGVAGQLVFEPQLLFLEAG
jgi:DnaK suppressor protein